MKEKELREIAKCALCGNAFGKAGLPLFYRVRVQRYALNVESCKRQQGLGLMLGGALAMVMGTDEDLVDKIHETEFTVCEDCASNKRFPVALLAEREQEE